MRRRDRLRLTWIGCEVGTMADTESNAAHGAKKAPGPKAEGMKGMTFSVGLRLPPSPVGRMNPARSQPRLLPGSSLRFRDLGYPFPIAQDHQRAVIHFRRRLDQLKHRNLRE